MANNRQLLVAFSGGGDSTALLVALCHTAPLFNFKLITCHINHNLRGKESEADENFCRQLCSSLNIECHIVNLGLSKQHAASHFSESFLRQKRYECLINFAKERQIPFLLTAHTLDDQAETMLFRLFRGTALSGLKGIPHCRKLDDSLYLLRPFISLTKEQCLNFLIEQNIEARQDSSNINDIYSRNYIRHQVLPVISQRFPDISAHLDSLRQIVTADDQLLNDLSTQVYKELDSGNPNTWSLDIFQQQPLSLQRRVLAHALQKRSIPVSFQVIEEIINLCKSENYQPKYFNLNQDWRLQRHLNNLFWQEINSGIKNSPIYNFLPIEVKIPGLVTIPILELALSVENYESTTELSFPSCTENTALVDLSKAKLPLIIRQRKPGDRISPLGMAKSVKLKKYLHTHKTRNSVNNGLYPTILIADQEEVLWLPGIGLSDKIKVISVPSHKLNWLTLAP